MSHSQHLNAASSPAMIIAVAPMEGVTTFPSRLWLHLCAGPEAQTTPFLRVTESFPSREIPPDFAPEMFQLRGVLPYKLHPQLMAVEVEHAVRAWPLFADHTEFLELNCGCPSPICVGKGAGSSMLRDPDAFHRTVSALSLALGPRRLAIKMRTGFAEHAEFPALVRGLATLPLARVSVHGRTRPQGYKGHARWDLIAQAVDTLPVPVIASGDVTSAPSLAALMALSPRLAGVLIGRGCLRNPWIFEEVRRGHHVDLPMPTLTLALLSFALLQHLHGTDFKALLRLADSGLFQSVCGQRTEAWQDLANQLMEAAFGRSLPSATGDASQGFSLEVTRQALGKTKMLWSYCRSSLPAAMFDPTVLRSPNLDAMLSHISRFAPVVPEQIPLLHNPDLDWLYAGEKKNEPRRSDRHQV